MRILFLLLLFTSLIFCSSKNKQKANTVASDKTQMLGEINSQSFSSEVTQDKVFEADTTQKRVYVRPMLLRGTGDSYGSKTVIDDNTIAVSVSEGAGKLLIKVDQTAEGWTLFIRLPKSETSSIKGKSGAIAILDVPQLDYYQVSSMESTIEIYYRR